MQKTQKEANWNMDNDSDFQDDFSNENKGNTVSQAGESTFNNFDQTDIMGIVSMTDFDMKSHTNKKQSSGRRWENVQIDGGGKGAKGTTFNEEFEVRRELLRKSEIEKNPMRFRLLAYSLTQFVPLRKNKYLERKRYVLSDHEAQNLICTCEKMTGKRAGNLHQSYNCGDSCLNRAVSFECCPWSCPCGPYCKNRKFQLHQNAYVYPVKTEFKGWGLLAGEFIKKGSFIMQYVGEIFSVDSDLGKERVNMYKNSTCTYLMRTTANEVIDPTFQGNIARFINHSCDPNCVTQKWKVLGEVCVGIFAKRDIYENEELTFDYQFDFFKTPFTKCYCGAAKCKGYLGVLATNVSSGTVNPQISAPECNYCKNLITDKESLMVCKGPNKETYHIPCVIKKEGGSNKQRIQQFSKQLDSKNFICRICRIQEKNPSKNEILDDSSSDADMIIDPQIESLYPWDCQNPDVLRFYDTSQDNQILDQIIKNEIDSLEKEYEKNSLKKKPSSMQRGADNFSNFYNFMSDLQKRLKQRIKQQKKQAGTGMIKFRRTKEMVFKHKFADNNEPNKQKRIRRRTARSNVQQRNNQSKPRARKPKRSQSINEASMELDTHLEPQDQLHEAVKPDEVSEHQDDQSMSDKQSEQESIQQDLKDSSESHQSSDQEQSNDHQDEDDSLIQEDEEQEEDIELELEQEEEEEEEMLEEGEISEGDEEGEEENEESFEDSEEENSNTYQEDYEEEEEGEYEEQENEELNLEQLQQNQDSESESEERKSSSSESSSEQKNQQIEVRKRAIKLIQNKTKQREEIKQGQPRRNSLILQKSSFSSEEPSEQQTFLARIQSDVSQQIDKFVKFQNSQAELKSEQNEVTKETKLNTFETVFNLAVPEYVEDYQCLHNFQIYWEQPWGGMVTVKIVSTFKQYQFFTELLQTLTDKLLQRGMLRGFYQIQNYQVKEPPQQYPFEILIIQVPKNFIRKIVGYQEKNLNAYRKVYAVDFDFNKDLLSDDVFGMNENTQLRVFGNSRDARYVNELIQKALEQIKMKTIFMQMSECKLIMDNVKEVKVQVDPCEIRIKKLMRDWKDLRHPFYYLPNYSREMVLIGSSQEIEMAERIIEKFLQIKREQQKLNLQQICFLLPIQFKMNHQIIKNELISKYGQQNLQVYFYEPTFPRKHMTVLLIGDWKLLLEAKKTLQQEVDKYINPASLEKNFDNFQQYTYHQQLRFSFKSLKRFVLEHDIKYLNHWDMVSSFIENMGSQKETMMLKGQLILSEEMKQREEERKAEIEAFIKYIREDDVETCINSLFVLTESKPDILEKLMRSMHVRKRELIDMMMQVLKANYQSYNDALTYVQNKHFYRSYFSYPQIPYWDQNQSHSKFNKPQSLSQSQSLELPTQPPQLISSQSEPQPYYSGALQPLKLKSRSRSPGQKVSKYHSNNDDQEYQKRIDNKATSAENRYEKHTIGSPSNDSHYQYHHRSKHHHHYEDDYHHRKYERERSVHRHHHRRSSSSSKRRRRERSSDRYYDKYHRSRDYHKQKHFEDEYRFSRREEDPRKSSNYHHRKHSSPFSHSRSRSRFAKFDKKHHNEFGREEMKYHSQQQQNYEAADQQSIRRDNHQMRHRHDYSHNSPSDFHQSPPQIVQGQQKLNFDKAPHSLQDQIQIHQQKSQENRMMERQLIPNSQELNEDQMDRGWGYHDMYQQHQPRSRSRDQRQPQYYHHQEYQRKRSRSRDRRRSRESSHSRGRGGYQHYQSSRGHQTHENPYIQSHHLQFEKRRSRSRSSYSRHHHYASHYHHNRDEKHHHEERGRDHQYHNNDHQNREQYNQHHHQRYHQENRERSPQNSQRYEDYRMKSGGSNYFRAPYQQPVETKHNQHSFERPSSFNMNKQGEEDQHHYHSQHRYHQRGSSSQRGYNRSGQQN